jgi:hypothetical protein
MADFMKQRRVMLKGVDDLRCSDPLWPPLAIIDHEVQ